MKKQWLIGGVVAASVVAITAIVIKKVRGKKEEEQKEPSREEVVQQRMEFPNEDQVRNEFEFEQFRARLEVEARAEFDLYYEQLQETLASKGYTPHVNQVGLILLSAIVHRNRMEKTVFNEFSKFILEGNAELLPQAIRRAAEHLDEDKRNIALQSGQRAMDMIIGGFAREEYLSRVAN